MAEQGSEEEPVVNDPNVGVDVSSAEMKDTPENGWMNRYMDLPSLDVSKQQYACTYCFFFLFVFFFLCIGVDAIKNALFWFLSNRVGRFFKSAF